MIKLPTDRKNWSDILHAITITALALSLGACFGMLLVWILI